MKTNFEKWKAGLTAEETAKKLAESMFVCGFCPARKSRKLCNGTCQENFLAWANAKAKEETTPPDTNWEAHAIFQDICDLLKEVDALAERLGIDLSADESEFVHPLGGVADRLFEARAFMAEFLNDMEATK